MEYIFFTLFAAILLGSYIAIRRQLTPLTPTAAICTFGSIITLILFLLARDTSIMHGIVVGIILGILFSGSTLAVAWYFHSNELREQYMRQQYQPNINQDPEEYYDED